MAIADAMKESMSAVIDGEGSELDIARVLKAVDEDPEARAHWQRIQQTRSLLRTGQIERQIDVSQAVRQSLESQPRRRPLGPLGSLAVAASVTFAMVLGGQAMVGHSPLGSAASPIATAVPGGVVPIPGAAPVQARFGAPNPTMPTRSPATKTAPSGSSAIYNQLARERFERYAQEHARSTANFQPNSLVPFARLPEKAAAQ
jgi:sigma-E factor negative regulatory protein RseA